MEQCRKSAHYEALLLFYADVHKTRDNRRRVTTSFDHDGERV